MVLDLIIILGFVIMGYLGFKEGFMKSVVGLTSTMIALVVAIALAKPIALLLNKMFGWAKPLGKLLGDGGPFSSLVSNKGILLLSLIVAIVLFVAVKIVFFILRKWIDKLREKSKIAKHVDSSLGAVLGVFRIFVYVCLAFGVLSILSGIGFVGKFSNWLFDGSFVAKGLFKLAGKVFVPIVKSLGASIGIG